MKKYIGTFKDFDNRETYQITICTGYINHNPDTPYETETFDEAGLYLSPDPVHIKCDRSDLTQLIMISQCEINLKTSENFSKEFLADTDRDIYVEIKRLARQDDEEDVDAVLFYGYVDPLQFNQGFAHNYEEITLNCTDPLGALEDLYINNTSIGQDDSLPMMNFIKEILNKVFDKDSDRFIGGIKTYLPNEIEPNSIKANAGIFWGEDADDRMNLYDTLNELLKYLGCTCAYEPNGKTVNLFCLYNVSNQGPDETKWFDAMDDAMDDSGAISFDEPYNKITLTCNIEPVSDEIKLIDDSFMYSDYDTYQKYMTELVSPGEGKNAYNGFKELLKIDPPEYPNGGEHCSYEEGYKLDHYCYVKRSSAWDFGDNSYITAFGQEQEDGTIKMVGDQSDVLRWLKNNPCKAAFVSFGKGNKINYKDNSPINNIPMTDYLVISICGHNDHAKNGHNLTMFNQIQRNAPICSYTGLQSLNLTPTDDRIINYIVISGKMILNPLQMKTGTTWEGHDQNWPSGADGPSNLYKTSTNTYQNAAENVNRTRDYYSVDMPALWHYTVPHPDNGDGAYYTQKWWKMMSGHTPTDPDYDVSTTDGIYGFLDNKENEMLKYTYTSYSGYNGNEEDVVSKLPILACQLKIGDKYCVERLDKGVEGQGVFEWMTLEEWNTTPLKTMGFEKPYFTIGIDPKVDDKIVGHTFSIQNNISYTMNVDACGTAIPIKASAKLNGVPEFTILGPINQMWNEIERIHPSFWRHTSWEDHWFWTLELLDSILISDLKIELKSDNGGINSKKTTADNDLMYYSDTSINYTEKLEKDIKICTPLTMAECETNGIKYQQSNSYVLKTNDEPFRGWDDGSSDPVKPEELYIDYYYHQYNKPAQIIDFCVDNGSVFGVGTTSGSYFGFSTILSQYKIHMKYPGLVDNIYYCMSMDWSLKNRENTMKVREALPYDNPFEE